MVAQLPKNLKDLFCCIEAIY